MSIDWFRDLIICVFGLVATGTLIFIAVLSYRLYHRTRAILDSIKATSRIVQEVSSYMGDEVVKPVAQIAGIVQGIRQGIVTFSNYFNRSKGGKDV
ncbi:hypothetical protein ACFLTP_06705 [Chloroflexota bacterium]